MAQKRVVVTVVTCFCAMITRLSQPIVDSITSSIVIPSLSQAVEEVACNSIDAGASVVDISINLETLSFFVVDNGCGITPEDLQLIGTKNGKENIFLTKATSKYTSANTSTPTTFGYKGEAISSLGLCHLLN